MATLECWDPYYDWKARVYAWLLCWKRIKGRDRRYDNNIAKKIALLLPVDFSTATCATAMFCGRFGCEPGLWWGTRYMWISHSLLMYNGTHDPYRRRVHPCRQCLRFTFRIKDGSQRQCTGGHVHSAKAVLRANCNCGDFGMCLICVKRVAQRENIILPIKKTIYK